MKIIGYSERGIVNALFYEIRYSKYPEYLLEKFFSMIEFPFIEKNEFRIKKSEFRIKKSEVLIEQSFSDFGDADVVVLISTNLGYKSFFIESKVQTYGSIDREYEKFQKGIGSEKVESSNLFTQLYHKVRLVYELQDKECDSMLQQGVDFPESSSKRKRKIGRNPIVLKAVELLKKYTKNSYFVAILPDSTENMNKFFQKEFIKNNEEYKGWSVEKYGYISWIDIEEFCRKNNLNDTLETFKYNKGQIYEKQEL